MFYRITNILNNDKGMSTIEYALGSLAAAALAAVLYFVVNSGDVAAGFTTIISDALSNTPA